MPFGLIIGTERAQTLQVLFSSILLCERLKILARVECNRG